MSVPVGIIGQMSDRVCMHACMHASRAHVLRVAAVGPFSRLQLSASVFFFSLVSVAAAPLAARRDIVAEGVRPPLRPLYL